MTERRPAPPRQQPSDEARRGAELAFGRALVVKSKAGISAGLGRGDGLGGAVKKEDNGALAAARSVGRGRALESQNTGSSISTRGRGGVRGGGRGNMNLDGTLGRQNSGGSVASTSTTASRNLRPRLGQYSPASERAGTGYLQSANPDGRSPSFIAATLAASRSASMSPNPTGGKVGRMPGSPTRGFKTLQSELRIPERRGSRSPSVRSGSVRSGSERTSSEIVLDTRSIPPTGNLIGMFEQNAGAGKGGKGGQVVKRAKTPVSVMNEQERTPTRARASSPSASKVKNSTPVKEDLGRTDSTPTRERRPSPALTRVKKPPAPPKSPKPIIHAKASLVPPSLTSEPIPPKQKKMQPLVQERKASLAPSTLKPSPTIIQQRQPSLSPSKPIPVPFKKPAAPQIQPQNSSSSGESFVSAAEIQPASYEEHERKLSWRAELASQNRRRSMNKSASLHTVDSYAAVNSLADAIVASSLASSRAASPSKHLYQIPSSTQSLYPPLPPPRRTKHHHHNPAHLFHNGHNDVSRTPSPGKIGERNGGAVLRTTMRKTGKEEVDEREKKHGRKNLMKKHPNKHHEGDRKRWRDSVTERERKRYEAVWASNRGLYTSPPMSTSSSPSTSEAAENEVCNLVVRDVWSRSRLGEDVLEEVYALVDRMGGGTLGKEEFVVGMWLVDQRLKGRKLPSRVGESVWKSVGVLSGIKVKVKKMK